MQNIYQTFNISKEEYQKIICDLKDIVLPEFWGEEDIILQNYLKYTYNRLQEERKVLKTNRFLVFDTGLFNRYYDPIFMYGEYNEDGVLHYEGFYTRYELGNLNISEIPQRADYFADPSLLIFDWRLPINIQYEHILDDEENRKRLPKDFKEDKMYIDRLRGAVDGSVKRVIANYKLAVPQYFKGNIQLLMPLYFSNPEKPDLALVVSKRDGFYQGHTCLTLEMAYNNARLIAKPEKNWLTLR